MDNAKLYSGENGKNGEITVLNIYFTVFRNPDLAQQRRNGKAIYTLTYWFLIY